MSTKRSPIWDYFKVGVWPVDFTRRQNHEDVQHNKSCISYKRNARRVAFRVTEEV